MRIVNAFSNGSWIDLGVQGDAKDFRLISDQQRITCHLAMENNRILIGLEREGQLPHCIVEYDLSSDTIIASEIIFDVPIDICISPNGEHILASCKRGYSLLSAHNLRKSAEFVGMRRGSSDINELIEVNYSEKRQISHLRDGKIEGSMILGPTKTCWISDTVFRNLRSKQTSHTHEEGHFATFVTDVTVEDYDIISKAVKRKVLAKRYAYDQEVKGHREVISMHPNGTHALVRHHVDESYTNKSSEKFGLIERLFRIKNTEASEIGNSYVELWDLEGEMSVTHICVAQSNKNALDEVFKLSYYPKPSSVVFKYNEPVNPIKINQVNSDDTPRRRHEYDTLWRRLMSLPAVAGWSAQGFVLLYQDASFRQFYFDGASGPNFHIGNFPNVGPYLLEDLLLGMKIRFKDSSNIIVSNKYSCFEVPLPNNSDVTLVEAIVQYDYSSFESNDKIAKRLIEKARPANVKISSEKPEAIVGGLLKMAEIVRDRYKEVVFSNIWEPTLRHGKTHLKEMDFCKILLDAPETSGAADVIDNLIEAYLENCGSLSAVVHSDHEMFTLTECVITSIQLRNSVSEACMEWVRRRDEGHEFLFQEYLTKQILINGKPLGLDLLTLIVRLGVQDANGQQPEAQYENQAHARSFMTISAMPRVAEALEEGAVGVEDLADIIFAESADHFTRDATSESPDARSVDFIRRISKNLNHNSIQEAELYKALLKFV